MTSDLARWRGALMESLPAGHPVHDPTRAFSCDELDAFEREVVRDVLPSGDALELLAAWIRSGNERFATIGHAEAWKVMLESPGGSRWEEGPYLTVAIREAVRSATEGDL